MRTLELIDVIKKVQEVPSLNLTDEQKVDILLEIEASIPSAHRYPASPKTLAILAVEVAKTLAKYRKPEKKVSTSESTDKPKPKRTTRRKAPAKKAE